MKKERVKRNKLEKKEYTYEEMETGNKALKSFWKTKERKKDKERERERERERVSNFK